VTRNILILCTGNSARSILGEVVINVLGEGRFRGFSAGSQPKGEVNPYAIEFLRDHGLPTASLRSKSWTEFAGATAPKMDFIFTVCDQAAGEACPVWPGTPITAHWGMPDPAAVQGSRAQRLLAFRKTYLTLEAKLRFFMAFDFAAATAGAVKQHAVIAGTKS